MSDNADSCAPPESDALESLRFGIEKSIRYHQRRRGWLELWHRWMMFVVIVSGSAAFSGVIASHVQAEYLALVAALIGAFDLATGIPVAAHNHAILQGKFSSLLAEISRGETTSPEKLGEWKAHRIEIEAEEPPPYWVLEASCYNEMCHARGKKERAVAIPLCRKLFMNLLRQENFGI